MRTSPLRDSAMTKMYRRKRNRLSDDLYRMPGAYFITICAQDRACVFWHRDLPANLGKLPLTATGRIAETEILAIADEYAPILRVDRHVVMPNHVHLLLVMEASPDQNCPDIRYIVRYYKRRVSQRAGTSIWQKGFHDHIVRNEAGYRKIWQYIEENPAKWMEDMYYSDIIGPDAPPGL